MKTVRVIETTCKTAVNRVQGNLPFGWSLNPYRGCRHACAYCYARASHTYLGHDADGDFESIIYAKVNIAERLRADLGRPGWPGDSIAIGTATDPYQPIEGRYRLMRGCLTALIEAVNPASITTKGTLVVRDRDLLTELAASAGVRVNVSLVTLDDKVWRALEPGAPPPRQRLRVIERLAAAGVPVGLALAPMLPGLTDAPADLAGLVRAAAEHGAAWLWSDTLHLEPAVRDIFLAALARHFPAVLPAYSRLFGAAGSAAGARYTPRWQTEQLAERVEALRLAHGLTGRQSSVASSQPIPARTRQLALPW